MSEGGDKTAKKQEEEVYFKMCDKCTKAFTVQHQYITHLKTKHEDAEPNEGSEDEGSEGESQEDEDKAESRNNSKKTKNVPIRSRMLQIQRNELEDNTYTFLGQLGEKNAQPVSNRTEIINFANDQKLTGQTNYAVNRVIRTPYEQQIKCSQEVPIADLQRSPFKEYLIRLKSQLQILEAKIDAEKQIWQLRDPMAPEEQVMDQFSLMDIKKLIQNYPKREVNIKYPHFSIFLLWIGRICKSPAFREFFLILGQYMAQYYATQNSSAKGEQAYQNWKNFYKHYESRKLDEEFLGRLKIFDDKSVKKFVDYFVQWTDLFRALNI